MRTALNIVWTVVCACLVMFMQAGFAMVETGFVRRKNVAHTMAMNFMVYSIGALAYWLFGFGLQMGGTATQSTLGELRGLGRELTLHIAGRDFGLWGQAGFFLPTELFTPGVAALFMFQMMFMNTALIIPTGALVERWKFWAFALFSALNGALVYPLFANWVWGGGFLSSLGTNFGLGHGHVDFAGSSVVHMTGGVLSYIGVTLLGPRIGKFASNGKSQPIPAHNVPMIVLGTFILAFGWFGFNAGSTMAGTDTRLAVIAVNTLLASAGGAVMGALYSGRRFGKPDVTMMCNGMLAGMAAITASCAYVASWAAVLIGAIAGMLVVEAALFIEQRLKLDDPVGAISVHGVCGAFGVLATGIFPNGTYGDGLNGVAGPVRGILYGDAGQLVAAVIGALTNIVWVGGAGYVVYRFVDALLGHRAYFADELRGLDVSELGMDGYFDEDNVARPSAMVEPEPADPGFSSGHTSTWHSRLY
jgi:ammonium transporter, Amt family